MRKSWNRLSSLAQLRFLPGLASDAGLRGRPCRVSIQVQGFRFFGRRARQHHNPPPRSLRWVISITPLVCALSILSCDMLQSLQVYLGIQLKVIEESSGSGNNFFAWLFPVRCSSSLAASFSVLSLSKGQTSRLQLDVPSWARHRGFAMFTQTSSARCRRSLLGSSVALSDLGVLAARR